jgi:hypothetical protein
MSVDIHAIRLSSISPTQESVEPSTCTSFRLRYEPFLYGWGCHIINDMISGPYVTIFCNLCQMQLNIAGEILQGLEIGKYHVRGC